MMTHTTEHSEQEFAAYIGIDWADTKHDICLQAAESSQREFAVLPHRPRDIDEWAGSLRRRFHGRRVAVSNGQEVVRIRLLSEPWPSSGSESCTGAGLPARPTTNQHT